MNGTPSVPPGIVSPLAATQPGVRVVKIGGRVQSSAALPSLVAAAWRARPGALAVVHGGGDEVSRLQRLTGGEPTFVGGRRVTREADLETLRMALSGSANKRLVSALVALGVPAVGISGEDGGLLEATSDDPALGLAGRPTAVRPALLELLLGAGWLPVVSPVGRNAAGGGAINVNGDDAAAAIAAALGAGELLLAADVAGVLVGGGVVARLTTADAAALVAEGVAGGGMAAKLEAASSALAAGVARVRISDALAVADITRGTTIVPAGAPALDAGADAPVLQAASAA